MISHGRDFNRQGPVAYQELPKPLSNSQSKVRMKLRDCPGGGRAESQATTRREKCSVLVGPLGSWQKQMRVPSGGKRPTLGMKDSHCLRWSIELTIRDHQHRRRLAMSKNQQKHVRFTCYRTPVTVLLYRI